MTPSPPRNSAVRHQGQGRAGCRRATRQTPHRYAAAAATTATVTTGANSQWVSTACKPNAGSMTPPTRPSLLTAVIVAGTPARRLLHVVGDEVTRARPDGTI